MKYRVGDDDYTYMEVKEVDSEFSQGECDTENKTIKVKKDLKGILRTQTQIHEFIHAWSEAYGHNQWMDASLQESICETISKTLTRNFIVKLRKKPIDEKEFKISNRPRTPVQHDSDKQSQ